MSYIEEVFDEGGLFSKSFPGYIVRPGQVELARAFDRAFKERRSLVAEGPTGIGKSFAYLVPAIYHTVRRDQKAIVATANIALEEQLTGKDLPTLKKILPWEFRYVLMKGRSNYICTFKYEIFRTETFPSLDLETMEAAIDLHRWLYGTGDTEEERNRTKTVTGDKSELPTVFKRWDLVSSGHDECLGKTCPHHKLCWTERARIGVRRAHVIVMNYHLRMVGGGVVTPKHDIMICDEAHDLAKIARGFLGWTVTKNSILRIAKWINKAESISVDESHKTYDSLVRHTETLFDRAREKLEKKNVVRIRAPWTYPEELLLALDEAGRIAERESTYWVERGEDVRSKRAKQMSDRAYGLAIELREICEQNDSMWRANDNHVYWAEKSGNYIKLESRPLDVSIPLREALYYPNSSAMIRLPDDPPKVTVAMISATMTSGNSFEFVRKETGVHREAGELIAPSPFNLKEQGVIVVPTDLPEPPKMGVQDSTWKEGVLRYAKELIKLCHGRSLLLFSSWTNLNYVFGELAKDAELNRYKIMKQGDMPTQMILNEFRKDETSVLLGVASMWQGVDVPGNSLVGLLIDKLPFPVPTEPVEEGLGELVQRKGGNSFFDRILPLTTITLRQGVGRLIRTRNDFGVVIITDSRLITKGYGDRVMVSLPDFGKFKSLGRAKEKSSVLFEKLAALSDVQEEEEDIPFGEPRTEPEEEATIDEDEGLIF